LHCDNRSKPFGWQWMSGGRGLDVPGLSPQAALAIKFMDAYLRPLLPLSTLKALEPQLHNANEVLAHISDRAIRDWPRKVRVIPAGLAFLPPQIDEGVLPVVYEALFTNVRFRAHYRARESASKSAREEYLINPLGLVVRGAVIYLVCTLFEYPDVRQLVLHRLRDPALTDQAAWVPKGFDLDAYIEKGEFDISSGKRIRLRAVFEKRIAKFIVETPLSKDQRLSDLEDGRVQLTASVMETEQLRWWLLSLGDQVEILAPDSLRESVYTVAQNMVARYAPKQIHDKDADP
jgi:predicted DNA-binding transcriptional regulator YafY